MSPEQEARLAELESKYPDPPSAGGFWGQAGMGAANTGNSFLNGVGQFGIGLHNLLSGDHVAPDDPQGNVGNFLKPYDTPTANTLPEKFGAALGQLPSELLQYALADKAVTAPASLLGRAAPLARMAGAGALMGVRDNRPLGTAAEFGAMEGVNALANLAPNPIARTLLRTAGNAAIPSTSAALRGQDPFSEQALVQGSLQGVLGSGAPEALLKRLRSKTSSPVPPEVTPTDTPSPSGGELSDVLEEEFSRPLLRPSADPTPPAVTPSTAELTTSPGEPLSQPAVEGGETQIGTSNVSAPLEKNISDFLMMNGGDHLKAAEMADGYKLPDVAAELRNRAEIPLGLNRAAIRDRTLESIPEAQFHQQRMAVNSEVDLAEKAWDENPDQFSREDRQKLADLQDKYDAHDLEKFRRDTADLAPEDLWFKMRDELGSLPNDPEKAPAGDRSLIRLNMLFEHMKKLGYSADDLSKGMADAVGKLASNPDYREILASDFGRAARYYNKANPVASDPLALPSSPAPEIAGIEPVTAPLQEPSQGRIGRLLQNWKLETDPVKKQAMWREMKALENANPPGMKLGQRNESGAANLPLLSSISGGALGASYGYATGEDDQDRAKRAMEFGLLGTLPGALASKTGRALLKLSTKAGRDQLSTELNQTVKPKPGVAQTPLGLAARWMEVNHPTVSKEVFRAMEKAKGKESFVRGMVDDAAGPFFDIAPTLTPAHTAVGNAFLNSPAKSADIAALDASPVPQPYKDFLKATKAAQIEGQRTLMRGESDLKKRITIASTIGTWATRQYRAIVDPANHVMDPATFSKVVDQWSQSPEFKGVDRNIVEDALSQHVRELGAGTGNLRSNDPRISNTLYMNRKDFGADDWNFLDQLSKDPALNPSVRKFIGDMVTSRTVDLGDQAFLRTLAKHKSVYHTDAARLRELADKEVLTPEYRSLLGEITDPLQRQMLSVNKLANSVRGAEAFNQLSNTTFADGRKLAYSTAERHAFQQTATPEARSKLDDYVQLPNIDGIGKMAGKWVPRDAADALNAMFDPKMQARADSWSAMLNSWTKEAITVGNISTQVRQFAQIPFFAAAARVYPWELPKLIGDYARVMKDPTSALAKELTQAHATNANFAQNDLLEMERRVAGEKPNLFQRARAKARKLYRIPDDLVRGVAYLKHKDIYLNEAAGKGLTGDAANQYAVDKVIDFLRDYTMNYSALPQTVNVAKHIPVVSPFISYSYEMARISKNLARDIATGSAADKAHAAAALAALYALPTALSIFGKNVLLNADDRKDWEKIQALRPTNQRFGFSLPYGREKDGTFKSIALNSWMPAADLGSVVAAAAKGDVSALWQENPLIGFHKSPMVSAGLDIAQGENYFTHEAIDTVPKAIGRMSELLPPLTPVAGYQAKKLFRSFTPNNEGGLGVTSLRTGYRDTPATGILSTLGVSTQYAQPRALLRRAQAETEDRRNKEKGELRRKLMSNRNDADKEEARRNFRSRIEAINRDYADKLGQMRSGN